MSLSEDLHLIENFDVSHIEPSSNSSDFNYTVPRKRKRHCDELSAVTDPGSLRGDLIGAKANIISLENKLKRLEQDHLKMQILYDAKVQKLEERKWLDNIQIRELSKTLTEVREREAKVKEELVNLQNKFDVLRLSSDVNIERFENQLTSLRTEISVERSQKFEELTNHKRTISELQEVLKMSKEVENSLKCYTADLEKQLAEKNQLSRDLEIKGVELSNTRSELYALKYFKENYDEYQLQIKTHEKKLYGYPTLEKENQQLREDNKRLWELIKDKLLLEEQVYDLNNRLKRFKEQQRELEELRTKQIQSDLCLNEWRAVTNGLCEANVSDSRLPHVVKHIIESLQKQEINLTADKVNLKSQLTTALHEFHLATSDLEKCRNQLGELQKNCDESRNLIHRLQNKLCVISSERDSYRLQLESYERDLTAVVLPRNGNKEAQKADKDLIKNLTKLVEEYRTMVAKLEHDLQNIAPEESNKTLKNQIITLQSEVSHLKVENEYLRQRRDSLEEHIEKLIKVEPKSHCNDSENLSKQVEHLKKQVNEKNMNIQNTEIQPNKEVEDLKQKLEQTENHLRKLKENRKTLEEFRNVVYILFGYKIDSENDNQYTLTSIFARDEEDEQLCFQLVSEGVMNLLENKYSLSLGNLIDLHLLQHKSIPTFLSAITLDLFNNQRRTATETVEVADDSNDTTVAYSDGRSSKISVYDSSEKSSDYSVKNSDSPASKASNSSDDSSDE